MHLAVNAPQRAIPIKYRCRIVINARSPLLEKRRHQNYALFLGGGSKFFGGWAGNWLREIEQRMIFALTEVLRLEEFWKANNVRTLVCGFSDARDGFLKIFFRAWAA